MTSKILQDFKFTIIIYLIPEHFGLSTEKKYECLLDGFVIVFHGSKNIHQYNFFSDINLFSADSEVNKT